MERCGNEHSELFYHCVQVLNDYNDIVSEEEFLKEYFQVNQVPDEEFVSNVLYECNRYSAVLKVFVDLFYKTDGFTVRRSEQNIYKVLVYIILFQFNCIDFKFFRGFINSVQAYQMHQFLQFVTKEDYLTTIKNECMKYYEEKYINEQIIQVLDKYRPTLHGILDELTHKMEGRPMQRTIPEPTKTKPFSLTASKERFPSPSKPTPKMEKPRPPPKSTYEPSTEQLELEKIRDENHRQGLHKLNEVRSLYFHFMQTEKSKKTQLKQARILDEHEKSLQHEPIRANPPPKPQANKIPVRLNVAAILKENDIYKKQEETVRQHLSELEAGAREPHEFFQWQEAMQKQDYENAVHAIERKRLEGKISYEEAILAKQRIADENRRIAEEIRRQTREAIEIHVKEKLKEEQRMKQLVEEVVSGRDNAKVAQQKLLQYKIDFVKQYRDETKQLMKQALEEAEAEMRQRAELIQQIRAYELVGVDRWKPIDRTAVSGYGFLEEMSIVEIRERLELLKLEREKEREIRHEQIVKEKQMKEKMITNTVHSIAKHRNDLTTQAVMKKRRNISAPPVIDKTNPELEELKNHLETKRAQRISNQQQRETLQSTRTSDKMSNTFTRSSGEWNRLEQVEKAYNKAQKRLAPSLIA